MVLQKALWFYEEPSPTIESFCKWCLKEPFFKVLWDTFIGSLKNSLMKWFFKEPLFGRFFEILP